MPSTNRTGSRARRQPQPTPKPTPAPAPASTAPTPPAEDLIDDAPPATPAKPAETAPQGEPSVPPPVAPDSASGEASAQEQPAAPAAPAVQEQPTPTPPPPPPPVDDATRDDVVEQAKDAIAPPPARPARVRLGRVIGSLHRVPLGVVQALLATSGSRIEALQGSPAIATLEPRVRATEGRCAPIVFTLEQQEGAEPHLFAGLEGYVAALNLGLERVFVVTIDAGDAGAAQSHLSSWAHGRPADTQDAPFEEISDE